MSKKGQKGLVDKNKANELNMTVLRRIDPETEEVRGLRFRAKGGPVPLGLVQVLVVVMMGA